MCISQIKTLEKKEPAVDLICDSGCLWATGMTIRVVNARADPTMKDDSEFAITKCDEKEMVLLTNPVARLLKNKRNTL